MLLAFYLKLPPSPVFWKTWDSGDGVGWIFSVVVCFILCSFVFIHCFSLKIDLIQTAIKSIFGHHGPDFQRDCFSYQLRGMLNVYSVAEVTLASFSVIGWKTIVSFPAFPVFRSCLDFDLISLNSSFFFVVACQLNGCLKESRQKLFLFSRDRKILI